MIRIISFIIITMSFCTADVLSTKGSIKFDTQMDGQTEMVLNETGLGIGITTPTANLHVNGNALISGQIFIGGSSGSSNLNINGTIGFRAQLVSADTTLGNEAVVLVDSSSDNITLTLPEASTRLGQNISIKKKSIDHDLWIYSNTKIDEQYIIKLSEDSNTLPYLNIISNGSQWYILNSSENITGAVPSDNLVLWLDADDIDADGDSESLSEGNIVSGNLIDYWRDKSSTNSHLSQASSASQPTLLPLDQNNRSSVYFDGTDDFIKISNFNITNVQHIFMVFTPISISHADTFISNDADNGDLRSSGSTKIIITGNGNDFNTADGQTRMNGISDSTYITNNPSIYSTTKGSTSNDTTYDNLVIARASSGIGRYPNFKLHEILFYSKVLTDTERDSIEVYLEEKWNNP